MAPSNTDSCQLADRIRELRGDVESTNRTKAAVGLLLDRGGFGRRVSRMHALMISRTVIEPALLVALRRCAAYVRGR